MKQYTTIKVGYSAGNYGCSGEYFTTIYINGSKHGSFRFEGLYGTEERIGEAMKNKGYKEFYTSSRYGRLTGDDRKGFMSEHTAIDYIKHNFKEQGEV